MPATFSAEPTPPQVWVSCTLGRMMLVVSTGDQKVVPALAVNPLRARPTGSQAGLAPQ